MPRGIKTNVANNSPTLTDPVILFDDAGKGNIKVHGNHKQMFNYSNK